MSTLLRAAKAIAPCTYDGWIAALFVATVVAMACGLFD